MNGRSAIVAIALLVSGACDASRTAPQLDPATCRGPRLRYHAETDDGTAAPSDLVARTVGVIGTRLHLAGFRNVAVGALPEPGGVVVAFAEPVVPEAVEPVRALVEREGTLEFRIVAPESIEREQAAVRSASTNTLKPPPEYRWISRTHGGSDVLVQTPEKPLLAHLLRLRKKGLGEDAPEVATARGAYETVLREQVFLGDQIGRAFVVHQSYQIVVAFELHDDRRAGFTEFTGANVNRHMAIVLDGRVYSSPIIKSALPGEGVIEGGGAAGFTEQEAKEFAAVLSSGQLPCRLVRVAPEETK